MSSLKLHPEEGEWDKGEEMDAEQAEQTYLPGAEIADDEVLVFDPTTYMAHSEFMCDWPCLSFDVLPDMLGNGRSQPPFTTTLVAGTQASSAKANKLTVMRLSNVKRPVDEDDEDYDSDNDDEADFNSVHVKHFGGVNRIRRAPADANLHIVSTWADTGHVHVFNLSDTVGALEGSASEDTGPMFSIEDTCEGFALDWSPASPFRMATGNNDGTVRVWDKQDGATWHVGDPLSGHDGSVEDIQWSPEEANAFATCSSDGTLKIWDCRSPVFSLSAHDTDVNVISWNRLERYLLVSGGDDGAFKIWDLRRFSSGKSEPIAAFEWHQGAITSLEWHPTDPSVLAVSGADDQVTLWDMAVELDTDVAASSGVDEPAVPPQLLFIHQGQTDIKELHWHPQIPGSIVTTAEDGFNFFKTISV